MAFYAYKKMGIVTEVFNIYNLKYFLLSLLFIPIILLIEFFIKSTIIVLLVSGICCAVFYLIVLILSRDEIYLAYRNR